MSVDCKICNYSASSELELEEHQSLAIRHEIFGAMNRIEGSAICPICGKATPHYHSPAEATMYNAKFVGVGPEFVQDALQEFYKAMDAMRRKGAREGQDIGYNAGFNVSADIMEAAFETVKSKLGFMAERSPKSP